MQHLINSPSVCSKIAVSALLGSDTCVSGMTEVIGVMGDTSFSANLSIVKQ